jgi:hypothetical protein
LSPLVISRPQLMKGLNILRDELLRLTNVKTASANGKARKVLAKV